MNNPRFLEPNCSANIKAVEPFRQLPKELVLPAAGLAIACRLAGPTVIAIRANNGKARKGIAESGGLPEFCIREVFFSR